MGTTPGLVSVIIPCFNSSPAWLSEALDSVFAQNYPNIEIVLADDGSTDAKATAYLDSLADRDQILLLRLPHGGPASARNAAVSASRGEFILPLDSDDRISQDYLSLAVAAMATHPHAAVVYGAAEYFGDQCGEIDLPAYSRRGILTTNPMYATCVIRRSCFDAIGGYDEHMVHGLEDHELWLRLCGQFGDPVKLPVTVFFYRISQGTRNGMLVANRQSWVAARSRIFQNNVALYAEHPEVIFEQLEAAESELSYWKGRYWRVDRLAKRLPLLERLVHRLRHGD